MNGSLSSGQAIPSLTTDPTHTRNYTQSQINNMQSRFQYKTIPRFQNRNLLPRPVLQRQNAVRISTTNMNGPPPHPPVLQRRNAVRPRSMNSLPPHGLQNVYTFYPPVLQRQNAVLNLNTHTQTKTIPFFRRSRHRGNRGGNHNT